MHPYHHALSSVRKHGGVVSDYLPIHNWFDASKSGMVDVRHRACRHHVEGVSWAIQQFGTELVNADGASVPVETIAYQHLDEDLSRRFSLEDWAACVNSASFRSFPVAASYCERLAKQFRCKVETLLPLLDWLAEYDDANHGFVRSHTLGVFWAEDKFGVTLHESKGDVPVRPVAEAYLKMRYKRVPTLAEWLRRMNTTSEMTKSDTQFRVMLDELRDDL